MRNDASSNSRENILAAAKKVAQAHGYGGLNFRDLAEEVGIRAASIYHHFPSKAELGAAVARRYWEDSAAALDALLAQSSDLQGGVGGGVSGSRQLLFGGTTWPRISPPGWFLV